MQVELKISELPKDFKETLELYFLNDSYIGLDQFYEIDLLSVNKQIEMQNGGKKKEELRDSEIIEETHQKQFIEQMQVLEKQVLHDIFSDDEEEEEAEDNE